MDHRTEQPTKWPGSVGEFLTYEIDIDAARRARDSGVVPSMEDRSGVLLVEARPFGRPVSYPIPKSAMRRKTN